MYVISDVVDMGEAHEIILGGDIKYQPVLDNSEPVTFPPEVIFD